MLKLAEIASSVNRESWAGPVLALLSESLEVNDISRMMAHEPDLHQAKWKKWGLGAVEYVWDQKQGEARIREFAFDLLMLDLVNIYNGYRDSSGVKHSCQSLGTVCRKIRTEIGIVVIK